MRQGRSRRRRFDEAWDPFDDYVVDFALAALRAGERICLVTLVAIEGASPRPLGAQMAIAESGRWVGYLSGGCVEQAVIAEAIEAIRDGQNRRVRYGRGSRYLDIRLPCGSAIDLHFDVEVSAAELEAVERRMKDRQYASLNVGEALPDAAEPALIRHYPPRRRLIILGIGPAPVCLGRMAETAGFDVLLFSPDTATRQAGEGEGLATFAMSRADRMPEIRMDRDAAVVLMFHDHEWETTLLPPILRSESFYIGAMGSRRAHEARLAALREAGVGEESLRRIHGPAGLFAGARSAPAIAVAILAEIMEIMMSEGEMLLLEADELRRAIACD
nr:XdhC family protein [Ancylobacter koreensis]